MKIVKKENSKLIKFINIFVGLFNKSFMNDYTTTIGRTVYIPKNWDSMTKTKQIIILQHEKIHISQYEKYKLLFLFSYIFFPLPILFAYFRVVWEIEAYMVNIKYAQNTKDMIDYVTNELTGPAYFWAGAGFGKRLVRKWIKDKAIKSKINID